MRTSVQLPHNAQRSQTPRKTPPQTKAGLGQDTTTAVQPNKNSTPSIETLQRMADSSAVVQRVVPDWLKTLKRNWELTESRIPATSASRLQILGDVTGRTADLATWHRSRNRITQIWQGFQGMYQANDAGTADNALQQPNQVNAVTRSDADLISFRAANELLIDHGLAQVKQELLLEHYVNGVDDLNAIEATHTWLMAAPDENLAAFKTRARANVMRYVRPGEDSWLAGVYGGNADPIVVQLGQISGVDAHWTLYRNHIGNTAQLRCDAAQGVIANLLVPSGADQLGVHVSLEVANVGNSKPRIFGRPANLNRTYNGNNRPAGGPPGGWWAALATALDNQNQTRIGTVTGWAQARMARIRAGWGGH